MRISDWSSDVCSSDLRDIVRLLSSYGPEALDRSIDEVMTKSPVTCDANMAVIGALSQMTQKRIRHLPVVDGGRLVGFVSIGDLVKYQIGSASCRERVCQSLSFSVCAV